ncbi:DtxR family transcriptional regulator [Alkaliphilus pronyensis]|uniref:Manganese transport regulator n=2 Tax=Alkaliphilus pronyensis TaxID=1482732 RepID=A0A6I0FA97_9FIRM|nr:DtxR family transcriptional regulator [Alkaliphilus pronyensis]
MLSSENKKLTSSMEDYLEMIYRTCIKEGYIRVNQLARKLNVRPSSATKIVQKLSELQLIIYQRYGIIQLTQEGKTIGEFLLKRHDIIQRFLKILGIEETLLKETELIEHDVSSRTLQAIDLFNSFIDQNPDIKKQYEDFRATKQKQSEKS